MDQEAVNCLTCKHHDAYKGCGMHHKCGYVLDFPKWESTKGAPECPKAPSAFDKQIDGTHYTDCAIQPFEFSMANKLDPMQHTIVKYVTRFRAKNGIVDLEKAKHTIDLLIEWEKTHGTKK